jgi:Na+-driven multidrug efflux pump
VVALILGAVLIVVPEPMRAFFTTFVEPSMAAYISWLLVAALLVVAVLPWLASRRS